MHHIWKICYEASERCIVKSLVIPVYKNESNIPDLLSALHALAERVKKLEVVFVVDGSPDLSWLMLREALPNQSFPSQLILLSRNFGSSTAIRVGLEHARGAFVAVMAADLQEPPALVENFFLKLEEDEADIVIGQRIGRKDPWVASAFSRIYWFAYRRFINRNIPKGGVDVFACNEKVLKTLVAMQEHNTYVSILLFWVGFRRLCIPYERQERQKGKSAWTFRKKFRLFLDSVFSFSDFPILLISSVGVGGILLASALGIWTLAARFLNKIPVAGYTTLLLVMLFGFSALLLTQGIIGSYLWRCFENTKGRPLAIVQDKSVCNGKNS